MKLVVFPLGTGVLVLVVWTAIAAVEQCVLPNTDPKFDCVTSIQFVAAFGSIAAVLTAIAAALARTVLHRFLAFGTLTQEVLAAALTSVALVVVFSGIIYWEIGFGGIAGNFFAWLVFSFVVSAGSLTAVKRIVRPA